MDRLSSDSFARARAFLETQGRPLDRALFAFRFAGAPAKDVLAELAHYQNADGGFGHALEPDMRTPSSSALATGLGLRVLAELGCTAEDEPVRRAVRYLLETLDNETHVWRVIPHDANAHPHAPWWHDEDLADKPGSSEKPGLSASSLARTFGGFRIIPTVQLVSLLWPYASLLPAGWLDDVTAYAVDALEEANPLGSGGGSDLEYAIGLAEAPTLPEAFRQRVLAMVRASAPAAVNRDPAMWSTYCITPFKLAPSPHNVVADLLADVLPASLDYEIGRQSAEGTWDPTWTWGTFYPDVWPQARREWQSHLTLETLTALRDHGRIA